VEGWLSISDLLRLFQQESGKSGTPLEEDVKGEDVFIPRGRLGVVWYSEEGGEVTQH